jgi:hypothetical protein
MTISEQYEVRKNPNETFENWVVREAKEAHLKLVSDGIIPLNMELAGELTERQVQAYAAIARIKDDCEKILSNPRIGTVSAIHEHIADVGEYELILTLKLK